MKKNSLPSLSAVVAAVLVAGWTTMIYAAPVKIKEVKADSAETGAEDNKAANAIDGDKNTFWHTQWGDESPAYPHEITLQLEAATKIKGFTYLPRQDEGTNGTIKEYEIYLSDDGKEFGKAVAKGEFTGNKAGETVTFPAKSCTYIKLKALSEVNGEAWASAAEIGVVEDDGLPPPVKIKEAKADSEETGAGDNKAGNAIDGNKDSFWHTQWGDASPACPHEIVLQLDAAVKIKGLTYLPRQDDATNGTIKEYEIYLSDDGKDFGKAVAKGEFTGNKAGETVSFPAKTCTYIKLKALSEINGEAWASAAEIGVVQEVEKPADKTPEKTDAKK
jgi:endo-alpha-N-acetylgalactosaminidase